MHPDVTEPLWTAAWRNSSRRDWGNLLAMLKQALPRHTASNDLLKKHISTPSPIFHTSSLIYSLSSFFKLDPFLRIVFSFTFCFPKLSVLLLSFFSPQNKHNTMRTLYWLILVNINHNCSMPPKPPKYHTHKRNWKEDPQLFCISLVGPNFCPQIDRESLHVNGHISRV